MHLAPRGAGRASSPRWPLPRRCRSRGRRAPSPQPGPSEQPPRRAWRRPGRLLPRPTSAPAGFAASWWASTTQTSAWPPQTCSPTTSIRRVQHGVEPHRKGLRRHERGVHHHLVAHGPPGDTGPEGFHHPGDVVAGHVRPGVGPGPAGGQPVVHVVEGAGPHPEPCLARPGRGVRDRGPHVLPRRAAQQPCLHRPQPTRRPAGFGPALRPPPPPRRVRRRPPAR